MEIHKPKAVHGWREFANEIGVIVIGVLIALGAEQLVEAAHWSHEVEAERLSLEEEAKDNLGAVLRREIQQPCVDRRLADIRTVLERHARHEPTGTLGAFAMPTQAGAGRGSWDIALSGQALPHMSHDERLKFSAVFSAFGIWDRLTDKEGAIWSRMSAMRDIDLFNEGDWTALHGAYAEAVAANDERRNFEVFLRESIGQKLLGMKGEAGASNATYAALDREICKPYVTGGGAG